MILFAHVDHRHQANRPSLHQRERGDRFLTEHQNIERVVVFGQRLRNEPVVGRVIHRRVENPVELQQPGLFVELVLDARPHGDLDDGDELGREFLARSDIVPGMNHRNTCPTEQAQPRGYGTIP